jgi:hypothetical protein
MHLEEDQKTVLKFLMWSFLVMVLVALCATLGSSSHAQTLPPFELFIDSSQTQAACIPKPNFTAYCQAFEGPMVSVNGGPFVKIPLTTTAAGVTSVTACDLTGKNCGPAQVGPVLLNIPTTVSITAPTATLK